MGSGTSEGNRMELSTKDDSIIFSAAAYPNSVAIMDTSDEGSLRDVDSDDKLDSQALFKSLVTQVRHLSWYFRVLALVERWFVP